MALLRGVRVALGLRSAASLVPGGSQALHRQPHPAVVASLPAFLSVGNGSSRRDLSASSSATGSASSSAGRDDHLDLLRHIEGIIKFRGGPITFGEYMQLALSSPVGGYYGDKYVKEQDSVIGARGDFVTSPEISQLFGEMIGLWCVTVWQQLGSPSALRLVELGPGRGTLMADLLRSTRSPSPVFQSFQNALGSDTGGIHLVEISQAFRALQAKALSDGYGGNLTWHRTLRDVPSGATPTIYIAHEFLDALPVHMFVKKSTAWTEVLVDLETKPVSLDPGAKMDPKLAMKVSPGATPAMRMLLHPKLEALGKEERSQLREVEVSAAAMEHALDLGKRVASCPGGGACLLIDYGYNETPNRFTCRAIHDHEILDDLLALPGRADLTADVDFGALRWTLERFKWGEEGGPPAPAVHGPVSQAKFLQSLGIEYRVKSLLEGGNVTEKQASDLVLGYRRLVGSSEEEIEGGFSGMGEVYKVMAIVARGAEEDEVPPVGF